jgi:hypothetical protein
MAVLGGVVRRIGIIFLLQTILYGYFVLVILWLKANITIPLLFSCWMPFTNRAIEGFLERTVSQRNGRTKYLL